MKDRLVTNLILIAGLLGLMVTTAFAQQTYATSLVPAPIVIQGGDTLIVCEGDSVSFRSSRAALRHIWQFGGAAKDTIFNMGFMSHTFSTAFDSVGFFQGRVRIGVIGSYDTFHVQVVPRITITPINQTICQGSIPPPVRLNQLTLYDSVVWSSSNVNPTPLSRVWRVNLPNGQGTYSYTVDVYRKVVVNGDTFRICNQSLTTTFNVVNSPNFQINGPLSPACFDDTVLLEVTSVPNIASVEWATDLRFNSILGIAPNIQVPTPVQPRYFAKITNSSGCVSLESFNVNLNPLAPMPTIIASQTGVNIGDTLYLSNGVPTGYGANWEFPGSIRRAGGGPNDSTTLIINSFSQEGWYKLRNNGWTSFCPSPLNSIYISVLPPSTPPPINIQDGDTIIVCLNDSVYLRTSLPNPPYQWEFGALSPNISTTVPVVKVAFSMPGFYRVGEVENTNSVRHSFDILVVASPSPITSTVTSPVCGGDTAQLVITSAQPTDSIQWDPLVNTTIRPDSAWVVLPRLINPPPFQEYRVSLREQHVLGGRVFYGCPVRDRLRVAYNTTYATRIDRGRSRRNLCNGGAAIVHTRTPVGPLPDSIIWYSDSMLTHRIGVGDSLLWLDIRQDTVVYMEARWLGACSAVDSFRLQVNNLLTGVSVTATPNKGCIGDTVALYANIAFTPVNYDWSTRPTFDTIIGAGARDTFVLHPDAPDYYVRISLNSNSAVCTIRKTDTLLHPSVSPPPSVRANQNTGSVTLRVGDTLILENPNTTFYGTDWTGPGVSRFVNNGLVQDSLHVRLLDTLQEGHYIGVHRPWLVNTCPSAADTVYVEVLPALPLTVNVTSNGLAICPGKITILELTPSGGTSPFTYIWDTLSPALTNPIFSNSIMVSPRVTTTYYYQVVDFLGVTLNGAVTVVVYPEAGLDAQIVGSETCFSQMNPLTLSATTTNISNSDVDRYEWDSLPNFNAVIYNSIIRTDSTYMIPTNHNLPAGTYQYYVRMTDVNGCQFIDSVEFKIGQPFSPQPISGDRILCLEDAIELTPPNDPNVNKWYWVLPNTDTLETRQLDVEEDSSDYLMGRWMCVQEGPLICSDTLSVDLLLDTINYNVLWGPNPRPICYGGTISITANAGLNPNVSLSGYEWKDARGNSLGSGVTGITLPNLLANDTIYLELTTDLGSCNYDADTLEILVGPPGPSLSLRADTLLCPGDSVLISIDTLLTPLPPPPISFHWQHPGGTVITTGLPFYQDSITTPSDSGTYRLWISNAQGCLSDTTDINIAFNQRPANPVVTYPNPVYFCHNDTLELTGTSTGCDVTFWLNPTRSNRQVSDTGLNNHRLVIPSIDPVQDTGLWRLICLDTMTTCRSRSASINVQLHTFVTTPGRFTTVSPICYGDTGVFNIGNPNVAYWYTDTISGQPVAIQDSFVLPRVLQQTIAYVRVIDLSTLCFSDYLADTIEVLPAVTIPPDDTVVVCYGDALSYSISAVGGLTYQWDGPNGYQNLTDSLTIPIVDSSTAGVYTLIATDGICTSDTARITVQLHPPSPLLTDSFAYVCFGDSLEFGVTNGPNCSSGQWYRGRPWWNPTYQPISNQTQDSVRLGLVDPRYQRGVSYWYYECTDAITGCLTRSDTIVAIIEDSLNRYTTVVQPDTICEGDAATLIIQNPRQWFYPIFYSYYWYSDTTAAPIDSGYTVRVPNITTDTMFYLIVKARLGGCSSNAIFTPVTINRPPAPDLQGDSIFCEGDTIRLSTPIQSGFGVQYRWNSDATAWIVVPPRVTTVHVTDSATALNSGTYTLQTRRLPNGCWSERDTLQIQVAQPPSPPFLTGSPTVCDGDRIVLVPDGSCTAYQWVGIDTLGNPIDTIFTTDSLIIEDGDPNYQAGILWQVRCVSVTGCVSVPTVATGPTILNGLPVIDSIVIDNGLDVCLGDTATAIGYYVIGSTNGGKWYGDSSLILSSRLSSTDTLVLVVTQDTTVYYTVNSSSTGCPLTLPVQFTVNQPPVRPTIIGDSILCEGEDLSLAVSTTAFDYDWNGPNGYVSGLSSWTLTDVDISDAGVYTVSIQDSLGCWSPESSIVVTINPTPDADITPLSQTVCEGETVVLDATPAGSVYSYDWFFVDPSGPVSVGSGASLVLNTIQFGQTGNYYVVVGAGSCLDTSSYVRIQVDTPTLRYPAQAMADRALCGIDSIVLTAQGGYPNSITGVWTDVNGTVLNTGGALTTLINNLNIGQQTFYWSLSVGACTDYSIDTVVIDFVPLGGGIANVGSDLVVCNRSVLMLDANPDSLSGIWRQLSGPSTVGILQITDPNTMISGLQVGNYEFIWDLVHPVCGLYDSDTLLVEVILPPSILADAGLDYYICNPDDLVLVAGPPNDSTIFGAWSTNSNALIDEPDSTITDVFGVPSGTTSFVWTLSTADCEDYSRDTVVVWQASGTVLANPDVVFINTSGSVLAEVINNDRLPWYWELELINVPDAGQVFNLGNGILDIDMSNVDEDQQLIYELCDTICPDVCDTALVSIIVDGSTICAIPNIFTPNGDGVNDFFEIPCISQTESARLLIFNRWGDVVYQTDQYRDNWNGTHRGEPLPDGTYFYVLYRVDREPIQGSVEIKR